MTQPHPTTERALDLGEEMYAMLAEVEDLLRHRFAELRRMQRQQNQVLCGIGPEPTPIALLRPNQAA